MTESNEYVDNTPFSEEALDHINPLRDKKSLSAEEYDAGLERMRAKLLHKVKAPQP
jgi:hypothetical protein